MLEKKLGLSFLEKEWLFFNKIRKGILAGLDNYYSFQTDDQFFAFIIVILTFLFIILFIIIEINIIAAMSKYISIAYEEKSTMKKSK